MYFHSENVSTSLFYIIEELGIDIYSNRNEKINEKSTAKRISDEYKNYVLRNIEKNCHKEKLKEYYFENKELMDLIYNLEKCIENLQAHYQLRDYHFNSVLEVIDLYTPYLSERLLDCINSNNFDLEK